MTNSYNSYDTNIPIFAYVTGIEQAKSFFLPPNKSAILMDNSKAFFYYKETNLMGQFIMKTFEFHEVSEPKPPQYVTTEDFDKFKQELVSLIKGVNINESDIQENK